MVVELLYPTVRNIRVLCIRLPNCKLRFHFVQFRLHIDTILGNYSVLYRIYDLCGKCLP